MTLHQYNPRSRYSERRLQQWRIFGLLLLVGCTASVLGFFLGQGYAAHRLAVLDQQITALSEQRDQLQTDLTTLRVESQTAKIRYEEMERKILKQYPEGGPLQDILETARVQITDGVDPKRLLVALKSARPPQNCTEPQIKRFVVKTPTYKGPASIVNVDDGVVRITAIGASSKNSSGAPEAWFDPAQPVAVTIIPQEGAPEMRKGVLPISTSLAIKGREYRFTIAEGARSFAKVTYDSCDYP